MSLLRFNIVFTGRVQGVFFRATAAEVAREFDVAGWVRNEVDGSVRCVVEGEREELERFVAAVQQAKAGNIDDTQVTAEPGTGELNGFAIRR
jgi:acylphosphatase